MITLSKTALNSSKLKILEHLLTIAAAVVSRLSMLFITMLNIRIMPAEEFGVFALLLLVANIVSAFVCCGGDMWLNRFTRLRHSVQKRPPIVSGLYLSISACLAGLVVLCAIAFAIFGQEFFGGHGIGIAWCLLWAAMAGMIEAILAVLRATNVIQRFFMIRDFFMPITLITSVILLKINSVEKFFMLASIIWLITLGFSWNLIIKKRKQYLPLLHWRGRFFKAVVISHTLSLIFNNILARLAIGMDTFLLARVEPISIVGQYRFISHFAYAFNIVQHFVFLALPWQLRQTSSSNKTVEGKEAVAFKQTLLLLSAFPALILIIFAAKHFLHLLGSGFQSMAPLFSIFLIIRFSELLCGPQHEMLVSNKKVNWDTFSNILAIGIGALVFLLALNRYDGVTSGLISVGCSSMTGQIARFLIIKRYRMATPNETLRIMPWWPILAVVTSMGYFVLQ